MGAGIEGRCRIYLLIVGLVALFNLAYADSSPYTSTSTVFIKYANAAGNSDLHATPSINIRFDGTGQYFPIIMDTGSVGIIASPDNFTPARGAKYLGPGMQVYTSSGIIEEGIWWTSVQEFYDDDGTLVATAEVPVLQVTKETCTEHARSCTPNDNPKGIAVMGIGFARESPEQPRGTPNYNAFLNLTSILQNGVLVPVPEDWCNGWVVGREGVSLGLTAQNTADAGFVKLLPAPQYSTAELSEWMPAPMGIKVNSTTGDGNVLLDTGVSAGFLTPPPGAGLTLMTCPNSMDMDCASDGDTIDVYFPDQTNPITHYGFTIGDNSNPTQPTSGVHVENSGSIFFNTSRHILGGIDFLYDNTNGYAGYIWNGHSGPSVGSVTPATETSETALTTSNELISFGDSVTFTATVTGLSGTPNGGVTFSVDYAQGTYVPLDNSGVATFSTSQLSKGSHIVIAKYSGDSTYIRSTSSGLIQNITR